MTVHGLLEILTRAAQDSPTVVIFDEFSSIARVQQAAGLLRTHLQHHFQTLGLVFAGSEPSMMRMLFSDQAQPFYAQADLVEIGPLSDGGGRRHRQRRICVDRPPRRSGPGADRDLRDGSSATVDAACRCGMASRRLRARRRPSRRWGDALEDARQSTAAGLERLYSSLREGEKAVLRILASGGGIFGVQAELLDLAHGTAQHARKSLLDRGHLRQVDDGYRVVDPLFADWIANRFPL